MRLTDERINYLSHHIVTVLACDGMIKLQDEAAMIQHIKKIIIKFNKDEEAIDAKVRSKINSIKRNIPEGSREWDILYEQYYSEEMNKLHV